MKSIKRLTVLANEFEIKLSAEESSNKGEFGGKGPFELPTDHKAAMEVTKGGSCCKNCKFVDAENHSCKNKYYIQWNGGNPKLPDLPLSQICSDWWNSK